MLIEQIHFPQSGPNWGKIALGTFVILSIAVVAYVVVKKPTYTPKPKQKDGTEAK